MGNPPDYVSDSRKGALLDVFVQPRAAKDEIVGVHGPALKIKVKAPPTDGRANVAALSVVAGALGIPRRDLELVSGATSRKKRIAVTTLSAREVAAVLEPLLAGRGGR